MDKRVYWLWLQKAFGAGSKKPAKIASQYRGGVQEFCEGGAKLWNSRRDLTDRETIALQSFSAAQAEARLEYAEKMGWQVITPECEKYPELLRNISDPPAALYLKGSLPDFNQTLSIAVAGSRKPLPQCEDAARKIGYQLSAGGACVVSGGAAGIDAAVLTGALGIPGSRPISVLPGSLDSSYIAKNAKLRQMICSHGGVLVSEHFSLQNPERGDFPIRNRLITGLSRGVVLIQAAKRSGTMLYASHAIDQNRDVFVYPGPADEPKFAGSMELIADGARAVTCGEDVLAEYSGSPAPLNEPSIIDLFDRLDKPAQPMKIEKPQPVPALADFGEQLSPQARTVLTVLGGEPLTVAQLEEATGLSAAVLLGVLTELEIEGLADSLPGKRYVRNV